MFNHNISLANLGLTAGNYSVWGIAYDKSGAVSNIVERSITFAPIQINTAPNSLQFNLNKTTFNPTESITITNGSVIDGNGGTDITRVDFQIRLNNGSTLNVSDATTFTVKGNTANFNYALNLSQFNLANGTHTLWAVAYDKANTISNVVQQPFTIASTVVNDWFSQNLKDKEVIAIARQLGADNRLNRNEMINIFRDTQDGGVVDSVELTDLKTIVASWSRFSMEDHVRVLSNKIVNGNTANTYKGSVLQNLVAGSGAQVMTNLLDKWFFGGDRPTAASGHTFTYQDMRSASLFGQDNNFSYSDIQQGWLGTCYFLSSLGAVANQRPSVIRNMFINNGDGSYTVKFFGQLNGNVTTSADYVTVDSFLPTNVAGWEGGKYYSGQRYANYDNLNLGLWVALAEKAYAQFAEFGSIQQQYSQNSYESIEGGNGFKAMPSITGTKGTFYSDINYSGRTGNMFSLSEIANQLATGKALTTGTISNPRAGIFGNHEYVIVSANITSGKITLYNPHARTNGYENKGILEIFYNDFKSNFDIISAA